MSSIENNQSLNNILEKIGVKTPDNTPNTPKSSLGQEDFLKLMIKCTLSFPFIWSAI